MFMVQKRVRKYHQKIITKSLRQTVSNENNKKFLKSETKKIVTQQQKKKTANKVNSLDSRL